MTTSCTASRWVLVAPRAAEASLRPLIEAHARRRPVRLVFRDRLEVPPRLELEQLLDDAAGVLVVGDRRRSPRSVLPGPFLETAEGRKVAAGWLPLTDAATLARFANAAAEVQNRAATPGPLALLGQWDDQVLRIAQRSAGILRQAPHAAALPVLQWTADRIVRRDLLQALRIGLGAAIYFGHGRCYGWAGYHGLHTRHLQHARGRPTGALLSLSCFTAGRVKVGVSFAESLVLEGVAAAAVGAVAATRTVDNWWWGTQLCEVLATGETTLGAALLRACPARPEAVVQYRLIGDPLAVLGGSPGAAEAAAKVWAPHPDESPTPPGYEQLLATSSTT